MDKLEKRNTTLIAEANKILYEYGLFQIAEKYGTPFVTGSYALEIMTRRDLDINIETDDTTVKRFFQLGAELASALNPWRILYMNEFISRHPRHPLGLYFGMQVTLPGCSEDWNIDMWVLEASQNKANRQRIAEQKAALDKNNRRLILEIKTESLEHPAYQRNFFSLDIYNAVIKNGIKTVEGFFEWIKENRDTDISI